MIKRKFEQVFRWPVVGVIRKGGEKTSDTQPGPDLEVLRFVGTKPEYQTAFVKLFGSDRVPILHVYMSYADPATNYEEACEKWAGGGKGGKNKLMHKCDSEVMTQWWDSAKNEYSYEPKPCTGGCKPVGRLRLIIPELYDAGVQGDLLLTTTSWNDTTTLAGVVKEVEKQAKMRGVPMNYIPLILRRVWRLIPHKMPDGKKVRVNKCLLELALADTFLVQRKPAPVTVIEETGEIVEPGQIDEEETIMPEWAGDDDGTESIETQTTKVLPAANGGPGWGQIPAWAERFKALCAMHKVTPAETKQIIGEGGKFGDMPYKDAAEMVQAWAEHKAAQMKLA